MKKNYILIEVDELDEQLDGLSSAGHLRKRIHEVYEELDMVDHVRDMIFKEGTPRDGYGFPNLWPEVNSVMTQLFERVALTKEQRRDVP